MMKKAHAYIRNLLVATAFLVATGCFTSCTDGPDTPEDHTPRKSTVLVYAVATNSLSGNLVSDKNEMLTGASYIDLKQNNILVFETQYKYDVNNVRVRNVNLLKLVKKQINGEDVYQWDNVKDYNDGVDPLDPERITEVINYVTENYPADKYGLVLWSHSTGSQPYLVSAPKVDSNLDQVSLPEQYSFGQDVTIDNGEPHYQINVDSLADAIPDHLFEYIWFDSCYMSNIESIYQLRNKCNTYVGYATEVLDAGLPYQYVLPFMVGEKPDLTMAAQTFFNYYAGSIATIAVTDMLKLEALADYCKNIYNEGVQVSPFGMMKYTRFSTGPFYDFGDYTKAMGEVNDIEVTDEEWQNIINECVVYKAATSHDFAGNRIHSERYSGISTHIYSFGDADSETEAFYKSLDWYKRVFN